MDWFTYDASPYRKVPPDRQKYYHYAYYIDFIADLILVFGVIIRQVVFVTMSTFACNFGTFV